MDCPACGSPVTLEVGPERLLSTCLPDALLAAAEDERIEITREWWDCGWHEARQIRVESIDTTEGDEVAVQRAALIDEITAKLGAIDSVATLEAVRAEIRRQRQPDSATTESADDTTE